MRSSERGGAPSPSREGRKEHGRTVICHETIYRFIYSEQGMKQVSSEQAIEAQKAMFAALPAEARKSTTLDNGRENHRHMELAELGIATYFADPYSSFRWKDSSWQRGTNEYHNGLLRRYLPKGSSFEDVDDDELADIVSEINNRPRKVLGFNTPLEVYNRCLGVRVQL